MAVVFSDYASKATNNSPTAQKASLAYSPPQGQTVTFGMMTYHDLSTPFPNVLSGCYAGSLYAGSRAALNGGDGVFVGHVIQPTSGPCNIVHGWNTASVNFITQFGISYLGGKAVTGYLTTGSITDASAKITPGGSAGYTAIGFFQTAATSACAATGTASNLFVNNTGRSEVGIQAIVGASIKVQFDLAASDNWSAIGAVIEPASVAREAVWLFLEKQMLVWGLRSRGPIEWLEEWLEGMRRWNTWQELGRTLAEPLEDPEPILTWTDWWRRRRGKTLFAMGEKR